MDKAIIYAGAIPQNTDLLWTNRNTEVALGMLARMVIGTGTVIDGLAVTPTSPASMQVVVGQGAIATQTVVDPTGVAYGSLSLNTSSLVKLGTNLSPTTMSALTAPAIAGQSQNWLLMAQFTEQDTNATVLPYYNSAAPTVALPGPGGNGSAQNTLRQDSVTLQWLAGTAATTGTQTTPNPTTGWVGVAVVIVAYGQTTITTTNIVPCVSAPFIQTKLPGFRARLLANTSLYVSPTGNDLNSGLSPSDPFATLQRAWSVIFSNYDLNGFSVTVNVAAGTYSQGLVAAGAITGLGTGNSVSFVGNSVSLGSVTISTSGAHCFSAFTGANISISGFAVVASGTVGGGAACGVVGGNGGSIVVGDMLYGGCAGYHMWAASAGTIQVTAAYTINGSALNHLCASGSGATILLNGIGTCVVSSTPSFSAFAYATNLGFIQATGSTAYSGSAAGARYSVTNNAVTNVNGAGPNFFPGSSAGSAPNGVYS